MAPAEEETVARKSLRAESSSSSLERLSQMHLKARLVAAEDYEVVATLVSTVDGQVWQMREDKQFGRRHYYNPETGERTEERAKTWMVLKNAQKDEFAAPEDEEPEEEEKEEPEGESFVSTTNGQRYTKYYDDDKQEYYYVNEETEETSWEHPDGELAELAQAVSGALASGEVGREDVEAQAVTVAPRTLTRKEHIEAKMQKLMLVEKKWMEKQPPAPPVPNRPQGFTGVYAESEKFWDPDADSYSVDGNEGSDIGMDEHAEALDAVDELDRYVSAVDMATPSDLRPLNAAKAVLENILLVMYEMVEEEEDYRYAQERRKNPEATTRQGKPIGVRRLNLQEGPELDSEMDFEIGRAKAAASISERRLKFEDSDQHSDGVIFRRLLSPMSGRYSGSLTFERVDTTDSAPPTKSRKQKIGYTGHSFKVSSSADESSHKKNEASGPTARPLNAGNDSPNARATTEPAEPANQQKPQGFFERVFGSRKDREKARLEAEKAELAKSGYVAPWERQRSRPVSKKRLSKEDARDV